jgi:hypothetical protein
LSGSRAGAGEVGQLHGAFVARLANEKPARIVGGLADLADLADRRDHIEHVVSALGCYVKALVDDLNANLPVTDAIDLTDWSGLLSDITADHLSAPISRAAEALCNTAYDGLPPRRPRVGRPALSPRVV